MIFDGSQVRTSDVAGLVSSIESGERDVNRVLGDVRTDQELIQGLRTFLERVNQLTQQLVIIILPVAVVGFLLSLRIWKAKPKAAKPKATATRRSTRTRVCTSRASRLSATSMG